MEVTCDNNNKKSEIKKRKQIGDEIDPEDEIDRRVADDKINPEEDEAIGHGQQNRLSEGKLHAARTRWRDLADTSGVGARSSSVSLLSLLSLSLSLSVCEPINDLKVKQKLPSFYKTNALFYGQSKWFSVKLYFPCATKHGKV